MRDLSSIHGRRQLLVVGLMVVFVLVGWWLFRFYTDYPETPGNAAIDLVLDMQSSESVDAGSGRICEARREEFLDGSSGFRSDVEGLNGYAGLDGRGRDTMTVDQDTVILFASAGDAGEPEQPWLSPPQRIWALEMHRERGRWRLCDLTDTGDVAPGFDLRSPCLPGERSVPEPDSCREISIGG